MNPSQLSILLLSLTLICGASIIFGGVFLKLGLPKVIGEILSGIILGQTIFGYFFPELFSYIFFSFEEQSIILSAFSWIGLILLMFTAGFNIKISFGRNFLTPLLLILASSMAFPMLGGYFIAPLLPNAENPNNLAFMLIISCSAAVTSIPVITQIFKDYDLIASDFAKTILCAALLQDLVLYVVISIALSIQSASSLAVSWPDIFHKLALLGGFALVSIVAYSFFKNYVNRFLIKQNYSVILGLSIISCFLLVAIANLMGINIIFSALLAGALVAKTATEKYSDVKDSIAKFGEGFFIPIYFCLVGFQLNLVSEFNPYLFLVFFLVTSIIKVFSVTLPLKVLKMPLSMAFNFGVCMNTRGGPGIVLATLAYGAKIIDQNLFSILVLSSLLSSVITGVLVSREKNKILQFKW